MNTFDINPYAGLSLEDIDPGLPSLIVFLSVRNNFVRVYETGQSVNKDGRLVYDMTNGHSYMLNDQNKWCIFQ